MGGFNYKLGKLNGRKVVTWWEGRKRKRFRFRKNISQADLSAELNQFIKSRERLLDREAETIASLFAKYLRDREIDGKPIEKQRHSWKALKPMFGHLAPDDVDKTLCRAFAASRAAAGRSDGTSWTDLSVLRASLKWGRDAKLISSAPKVWLPPQPKPKDRHLTRDEAEKLLAEAKTPHIRLFILLALGTAGRASSLLELTWDRVDFGRGQIDLRTAEQNRIKRRAIVPMNATLRAALSEAQTGSLTPYVIEWAGERVRSIKRAFSKAAKRAGLDDVTPHTLRHTAAVWMAEAGESMPAIAQYLGHADSRTTERVYARFSPDYLRRASAALEMPAVRKVK
jgi:integrase